MADDPLTAVTAEAADTISALSFAAPSSAIGKLAAAAVKLAAAVRAAQGFHERTGLYGNAATEGEPGACPHDPDSSLHFEDPNEPGEWLCKGKPEGVVCSTCTDEDGLPAAFPCPEVEAILNALNGKADGNG